MKTAFYLPAVEWTTRPILPEAESRHAKVMRLKLGDEVLLMNGEGKIADCRVARIGKKEIELEIGEIVEKPRPPAFVIIALALSKAIRRGFFMEKATELGAGAIWLWQAERSQVKASPGIVAALRAQLAAGMKQSLNPWLPELFLFNSIGQVASEAQRCDYKYLPYEEENPVNMLLPGMLGKPGRTIYVIGPEGGIAPGELTILEQAGFTRVSLGRRVLRCETAATLCLGLHYWASEFSIAHREGLS